MLLHAPSEQITKRQKRSTRAGCYEQYAELEQQMKSLPVHRILPYDTITTYDTSVCVFFFVVIKKDTRRLILVFLQAGFRAETRLILVIEKRYKWLGLAVAEARYALASV